jgi:hypothetical protein
LGHFVCCKKTPCKKHPKEFFYNTSFLTSMSPLLLRISYHTYLGRYVRMYIRTTMEVCTYVCTCVHHWLILVVVLVLHLSIMCNSEESVEAESFPFLKVGFYIKNFPYLLVQIFCTRVRGADLLGYVELTLAHFQHSPVWKVS